MIRILPDQKTTISPQLEKLARKAEAECKRKFVFSGSPMANFIGRIEWRTSDILIEVESNLPYSIAEYVAAHELGHALQLARGCAITSGRLDEPGAVEIATQITDFIFDPMADTLASEYGLPMASCFQSWIESTQIITAMQRPRRGRIFGDNWHKAWEGMTKARVCKQLGLVPPKPTRDFWTIYVALDLAKLSSRAMNLGLGIANDILDNLKRVRLLAKLVNDLLEIGSASSIDKSTTKIKAVLDYFKTEPGHIYIYKPLKKIFLIDGKWRYTIPGNENIIDEFLRTQVPTT